MTQSDAFLLVARITLAAGLINSFRGMRRRQRRAKDFQENSRASNPAVLRVSRKQYARYRGSNILTRTFFYWNSFLPEFTLYRNIIGGFAWNQFSRRFLHGNLNAAMVVDAQRGLAAAFTDLRSRPGYRYPAIKIFKEKLHLLSSPAKNGDTFAAVSLYERGENSGLTGKWLTFYPMIIDCAVKDEVMCEFAKAKIPDAQWAALEVGISQLIDKTQLGLHDIDLATEFAAER